MGHNLVVDLSQRSQKSQRKSYKAEELETIVEVLDRRKRMLIAIDAHDNRIHANSGVRYKDCFCPGCGEPVRHRIGKHNRPHFAHMPDTDCILGKDKDNKGPWHMYMQGLFSQESQEVIFRDKETGEVRHIADVFIKESNTVIEFQHSPISAEDIISRTNFHISEGRRVVWVFDESKDGSEFGRLKRDDVSLSDEIYADHEFRWPRSPRKVLGALCPGSGWDQYDNLSICISVRKEDARVHRIVNHGYDYCAVTLSIHPIKLCEDMNCDEFFMPERYWLSQSPWLERVQEIERRKREMQAAHNAQLARQGTRPVYYFRRRRRHPL